MALDVFITGASGVLGSQVAEKFRRNDYKVIACSRTPAENMDAVWDISTQDHPEPYFKPQVLIHSAACIGYYNQPFFSAISLFKANVIGTWRVVKWGIRQKVKKLILVSGAIVYGEWKDLPKSENDKVRPFKAGAYAVSKWCSEKIFKMAAQKGCDISIFRLSSLYGRDYENGLVQRLLREGYNNKRVNLNTPYDDAFDLLHVSDAANAIYRCVKSNLNGLWNIGGGELTTIKNLAEICAEKVKARVIYSDAGTSRRSRIINWVNDEKARKIMGHNNYFSLERGIEEIKVSLLS